MRVEPPERMVQLLQNLADEFADFAQGMVRGNPLLRMNVRKHPALILRSSAHLQSSRRIRGGLNHHSFALARFFSKLLEALTAQLEALAQNKPVLMIFEDVHWKCLAST